MFSFMVFLLVFYCHKTKIFKFGIESAKKKEREKENKKAITQG